MNKTALKFFVGTLLIFMAFTIPPIDRVSVFVGMTGMFNICAGLYDISIKAE